MIKIENDIFKSINAQTEDMFISNSVKTITNNSPTLIVGLGGTGAEALLRVKKTIKDRCVCADDNDERPNNLEYLVIDTDPVIEDMERDEVKLQKKYSEFLLMQNADLVHIIGEINKSDEKTEDVCKNNKFYKEIREWFSDEIPESRIVNGAAGIRQAGRLILHLNFMKVYNAIFDKICKITRGTSLSKTEVEVYLLFGVGGGTGSGIFIDIAYLIRHIIYSKGGNPNINGIVFLPDVSLSKKGIDLITKNNIMLNGYAALLELDYFMELDRRIKRGGNSINTNHNYSDDLIIKWDKPIFEHCYLLGASDEDRRLSYPPTEMAKNTVAELIWSLIGKDTNGFTIKSFLSNTVPHTDDFVNNTDVNCYKSRKYIVVGAASYFLPYNEATTYLLKRLSDEINTNSGNVKRILKDIGMNSKNIYNIAIGKSKSNLENNYNAKSNVSTTCVSEQKTYYNDLFKRNSDYIIERYSEVGPQNFYSLLESLISECNKIKNNKNILIRKSIDDYEDIVNSCQSCAEELKASIERKDIPFITAFKSAFSPFDRIKDDCRDYVNEENRQMLFRLATPKDIIEILDENFNSKKYSINDFRLSFYSDLFENIDKWCGITTLYPMKYISLFFEKLFDDIISESVNNYIENNQSKIETVIDNLFDRNKIQFPFSHAYNSVKSGEIICSFVRVPKEMNSILQNTSITMNQNINYGFSNTKNRVGQITLQVNLSLDDYFEFENLKKYTENKFKGSANKKSERHYDKRFITEYGQL